ncbi:hypothetical protein GE061_006358 [Apolygus lucorum]|uniref:Peptidase S1 domain-containing protein n=1 Tax=Apolygus lucorum TaxID=248454 RepID=A0A8S9WVE3_APOLU|nr:hypothetical protein GE061_006358 [Apolygus lucorum]
MAVSVLISLLASISLSRAVEIGETQYLQGDVFPWIEALLDNLNEVSCNANLISNFVSVTACECLAIRPVELHVPLTIRNGSEERYSLLGGTHRRWPDVDPNNLVKPISFHVHDKCNVSIIFGRMKWVYNYGIIMHNPFVWQVGVRLEPMPTWSIDPFRMETRFKELVTYGFHCFVVGWTSTSANAVRIRVGILDGLNCSKYSCEATKVGHGECSPTAVTCAANTSSDMTVARPFCHLEPGMPLICGQTADTYAITEGSLCDFDKIVHLWKVSPILGWIDKFVKTDVSKLTHNQTHKGYFERQRGLENLTPIEGKGFKPYFSLYFTLIFFIFVI